MEQLPSLRKEIIAFILGGTVGGSKDDAGTIIMTGVKTILTGEYYPGDEMMHE